MVGHQLQHLVRNLRVACGHLLPSLHDGLSKRRWHKRGAARRAVADERVAVETPKQLPPPLYGKGYHVYAARAVVKVLAPSFHEGLGGETFAVGLWLVFHIAFCFHGGVSCFRFCFCFCLATQALPNLTPAFPCALVPAGFAGVAGLRVLLGLQLSCRLPLAANVLQSYGNFWKSGSPLSCFGKAGCLAVWGGCLNLGNRGSSC